MLDYFIHTRAHKCRLMGSAALDLAYVACGRLDAYIEASVSPVGCRGGGCCSWRPRAENSP